MHALAKKKALGVFMDGCICTCIKVGTFSILRTYDVVRQTMGTSSMMASITPTQMSVIACIEGND